MPPEAEQLLYPAFFALSGSDLFHWPKNRHLKLGDTHPHTQQSLNHLIELYEAWNKPEKANEWRAKLPQTEVVDE
ncbi:MAG: hypothetical protein ACYS6K_08590 [Planctomycetota bacterium]